MNLKNIFNNLVYSIFEININFVEAYTNYIECNFNPVEQKNKVYKIQI